MVVDFEKNLDDEGEKVKEEMKADEDDMLKKEEEGEEEIGR